MPWFDVLLSLGDDGAPPSATSNNGGAASATSSAEVDAAFTRTRRRAEALFAEECSAFEQYTRGKAQGGQARFMQQVLKSGTSADRSAALTLHVQESPFHRLASLASLSAMARKPNHKVASAALESLKELFVQSLLPSHRKLRSFVDACRRFVDRHSLAALAALDTSAPPPPPPPGVAPLSAKALKSQTDRHDTLLMLWLFEDALKVHYAAFVSALAGASRSTLPHFNKLAMHRAYDVLRCKPEGEELLLKLICNKLGDPSKPVSSKAVFLIHKLLAEHPAMLAPIADEIELIVLHPRALPRARYYAAVCCAQLRFTSADRALAVRLIQMYLRLFAVMVKSGSNLQGRALAAILIGVNRALPFADAANSAELDEQLGSLVHVAQSGSLAVAVQALSILLQVAQVRGGDFADRFYRALYQKMLTPELLRSSRQATFLNVVYRALAHDANAGRQRAIVKRLLQISLVQGPAFAAGALVLVSEICKVSITVKHMITRRPRPSDDDKDLQAWNAAKTAAAAAAAAGNDGDADETSSSSSSDSSSSGSSSSSSNDGSSSSSLSVVDMDDDKAAAAKSGDLQLPADLNLSGGGGENTNNSSGDADEPPKFIYEPLKLDPRFARAELVGLFELTLLANHAHPSVSTFARTLLEGKPIDYTGNPLEDFATMAFLDRFVYRAPKKRKSTDPAGGAVLPLRHGKRRALLPVNSDKFLNVKIDKLQPTDVFFHRFFKRQADGPSAAPPPTVEAEDEAEAEADEPNDVELDDREFDYENLGSEDFEDDGGKADRAAFQPWTLSTKDQEAWARSVMEDDFGVGGDVGDEGDGDAEEDDDEEGDEADDLGDDDDGLGDDDDFDETDLDNFAARYADAADDDDDGGEFADDDDEFGGGEDDDDDEDGGAARRKGGKRSNFASSSSTFADADDLDLLLDTARSGAESRVDRWAEKGEQSMFADTRRRAQGGRGGGRGRGRGGGRGRGRARK